MQCPACERKLAKLTVDDVLFYVCHKGCGGVWFGKQELQQACEQKDYIGKALVKTVQADPDVPVDASRKRECPQCAGWMMMRRYFSQLKDAQVDECAKCGGVWVDHADLETVRRQFVTDGERRAQARAWAKKQVSARVAADGREEVYQPLKSSKFGRLIRKLLPY